MTRTGDEQGPRREPAMAVGRGEADGRGAGEVRVGGGRDLDRAGRDADKDRRIADAERRAGELLGERTQLLERAAATDAQAGELAGRVAELERALRSREDFLALVGHDLRTPLTPLLTALEVLREEPLSERARRCVDILERNLAAHTRLIDDLVDLSRIQQGRLELATTATALAPVVERAVEQQRALAARRSVSLAIDTGDDEVTVQADAAKLEQAIGNVVASAIRRSPAAGRVTVRSPAGGERVRVEVESNGGPPTPEELRALLDPFGPTPGAAARRRLGLELPVAQAIVDAHGGKLTVEATPSGTTRLTIELPSARLTASALPSPRSGEPLRILLVDDHEDSLTLTRMMLERRGYAVTTAGSVREALGCAETSRFDVLISDIGLPDDSGLSLLPELAKRGPITGIAVSGFGRDADIARSKAAGYVDHLTKPVSMQRLHELIQGLFG